MIIIAADFVIQPTETLSSAIIAEFDQMRIPEPGSRLAEYKVAVHLDWSTKKVEAGCSCGPQPEDSASAGVAVEINNLAVAGERV